MKIRLTLINGGSIDFDAPANFSLVAWVTSVRESGRWLHDGIYVPHESILCVLRVDDEGKPVKFEIVAETIQ